MRICIRQICISRAEFEPAVCWKPRSHAGCMNSLAFLLCSYTSQGNWDLVGNSIPVFFIRDGAQFPDLVHAKRPNPKSHVQVWLKCSCARMQC